MTKKDNAIREFQESIDDLEMITEQYEQSENHSEIVILKLNASLLTLYREHYRHCRKGDKDRRKPHNAETVVNKHGNIGQD